MTWWQFAILTWVASGAVPSLVVQLRYGGSCYTCAPLHPVGIAWSLLWGAFYGPIAGMISIIMYF